MPIVPVEIVQEIKEKKIIQTSLTSQEVSQLKEKEEKLLQLTENKPLLVLITGGAASGKSILTKKVKEWFEQNQQQEILTFSIDSYYSFSPLLFHLRNPNLQEIFK